MNAKPTKTGNLLVLTKITAILDSFTLREPRLSLSQIRDRTGLPQSTVQRLVTNLVDQGFLDRDDDCYRIGMRMAFWASPATRGIPALDLVSPVLSKLRDLTGESTALYIAEGTYRVCIALAETHAALRREMHVGKIIPLHIGSAGHVLLAWQPELMDRILESPLEPMTEESLTAPDRLQNKVREARRLGYSISAGEREDGASGLSAPVFDSSARIYGAVSILGPSSRMPVEKCEGWVEDLLEAAENMTRVLGGRFPGETGDPSS